MLRRRLVRAGAITYTCSALSLSANLITGILAARVLGPEGRGIVIALASGVQLCGFLFAAGVAQSLSYYAAREPQRTPQLVAGWLVMLLPLSALAVVVTELLVPVIFASESQAIAIGRWFALAAVLVIGLELVYGILLGRHDYVGFNLVRVGQPALTALGYLALWRLERLSVAGALASLVVATALVVAFGLIRGLRGTRLARPDVAVAARSLWYGVRAQGSTVAANLSARLDVAVLPAFVSAAAVGLYSVATNVSLIVYQVASTFAAIVLPAAAADQAGRARAKVVLSAWATLSLCGLAALALAIVGEPLLGLVYGDAFRPAIEPLRLLLPGAVLFAVASIVASGLGAEGRPFAATLAHVLGAIVMAVGLAVFAPSGGTTAAALVSTASYATVFSVVLWWYARVTALPAAELVPTPRRLRARLRALTTLPAGTSGRR